MDIQNVPKRTRDPIATLAAVFFNSFGKEIDQTCTNKNYMILASQKRKEKYRKLCEQPRQEREGPIKSIVDDGSRRDRDD